MKTEDVEQELKDIIDIIGNVDIDLTGEPLIQRTVHLRQKSIKVYSSFDEVIEDLNRKIGDAFNVDLWKQSESK